MHSEPTQAGGFLPKLIEQAGLLKEDETTNGSGGEPEEGAEIAEEDRQKAVKHRYAKTDKAISQLNVILVYKKLVQGLVYSPPDSEKHLALDAKLQVSVALAPDRCVPRPSGSHQSGIGSAPLL